MLQWRILVRSSCPAEGYRMRHCIVPLDLTAGSGFATDLSTPWNIPVDQNLQHHRCDKPKSREVNHWCNLAYKMLPFP